MKNIYKKESKGITLKKCNVILITFISLYIFSINLFFIPLMAQEVLFDFDNLSVHSSLPGRYTVGGITAHFSATGDGFSIQDNSAPVFPIGFSGNFIDANSVFAADLLVSFDQTLTDFSIMFSTEEYGCDCSATMRVTASMNGSEVGTNTKSAAIPGTWPVDTLRCSFPQGFNSVVVHYDSPPPCPACDYGPVFLADNMRVTELITNVTKPKKFIERLIIPNPFLQSVYISFSLLQSKNINITVYDFTGKLIKNLFEGHLNKGEHQIQWDLNKDAVKDGVYFLNLTGENFSRYCKLIVMK
jgi:hypothetical protein